jgi:hypothetical protein
MSDSTNSEKVVVHFRVESYKKRIIGVDEVDMEMTRELTEWEKHLLQSQEVVEVRGKVIIFIFAKGLCCNRMVEHLAIELKVVS